MPSLSTSVCLATVASVASLATAQVMIPNILFKDVVVIGGGASGAYAAVRLRDDYNKSIALVEKSHRLGGMVNTYVDPTSGKTYDYGVEAFLDVGNSTEFFDRFNITLGPIPQTNVTTEYIDFNTGDIVNLTLPTIDAQFAAMQNFLNIVEPWTDYLQPGYWNFPQPADIPADFLIPYGDFIIKYGLQDAIPLIYESTGLGLGNMTQATTMFELQAFGTYMAQAFLGQRQLYAPATGGNQALYNAIEADLGDDVLYNSTVIDSWRTDYGVFLTVQNSLTNQITLITARQLLVAIEPTANNTAPLDLDENEQSILDTITYSRLYCGLLNNTALVPPMSYDNMAAGAAPDNYLVLPNRSFTNNIQYMGDNLFHVIVIGNDTLDETGAKALVQENFNTLLQAGRLGETGESQELSWVAFSVHGPMHARVTPQDVQNGFMQQLYSLQGSRSTWWTGGAFSCNFQTTLWAFDETLIPLILANLD